MNEAVKTLQALKGLKESQFYPALKLFLETQAASALAGMDGAEPGRTQQLSGKVLAFNWIVQYFDHQLDQILVHLAEANRQPNQPSFDDPREQTASNGGI